MLDRLRATKRTLSCDENSVDYRIQKITKKAATTVNPQILSRSAIPATLPSAPNTPAFATGPKLDLAATKHLRVLAISESEAWFGKTMMPSRQPHAEGHRGSPLANTNGDTETAAAKKCGLPAQDGAEAEGMAAGHHADMSAHGMGSQPGAGLPRAEGGQGC